MRLRELAVDELELAAPMWRSLYDHQLDITPHLAGVAPARTAAESWAFRRASYERWLREPGAFGLLAEVEGEAVGYAVARLHEDRGTSWDFGAPRGELETLAVLAAHRGGGIGTALLAEVRRRLSASGARTMTIGVISTNASALRFYERRGGVPFMSTLVAPLDEP